MQQVDYRFEDHGSICVPAIDWRCQRKSGSGMCEDFYIRWGNALVVEPRFVEHVAMQLPWIVE